MKSVILKMPKELTEEQKEKKRLNEKLRYQKNREIILGKQKEERQRKKLEDDKLKELNKEEKFLIKKKKISERNKNYRENNKESISFKKKMKYELNKEEILLKRKEYQKNNSTEISLRRKERYNNLSEEEKELKKDKWRKESKKILSDEIRKDSLNKRKREYYKNNKEKKNTYQRNRRHNDPIFNLKHNIRRSIHRSLNYNNFTKKSRTHEILGCSYDELKLHLEAKFENWMNWENYGNPKDGIFEPNKSWDIDHIIPVSIATDETRVLELNHYTNLQPLCSYYNRWIKKDNY
jgi:hypothetical protein